MCGCFFPNNVHFELPPSAPDTQRLENDDETLVITPLSVSDLRTTPLYANCSNLSKSNERKRGILTPPRIIDARDHPLLPT